MSRSTFTGPVAGAYDTFTLVAANIAASTVVPGMALVIPAACVIEEITFSNRSATASAGLSSFRAKTGTDPTAGTNLLGADGTTLGQNADSTATPTGTGATLLASAARTRAKGDQLVFNATTDATVGNRTVTVTVNVRYTGHVVASAAND